jgi:hypothetical protein
MITTAEEAQKVVEQVETKCVEISDILMEAGLPRESGMFLGVLGLFLANPETREKLMTYVLTKVEEILPSYKITIN